MIARIPVIPHFNTGLKTAAGLADLLARVGVREVHLLPFHQLGENKYAQLQVEYQMAGFKQLPPRPSSATGRCSWTGASTAPSGSAPAAAGPPEIFAAFPKAVPCEGRLFVV